MTDTNVDTVEEEAPKASKLPLILGLLAALVGAGGGFFATFSGMILAPPQQEAEKEVVPEVQALPDVAYVPIDPMIISVGPPNNKRHLRFRAQLEVPKQFKSDVESVMPRVVDVLNGYLRAVSVEDLEEQAVLLKLRSHMLRRVDIVTGEGRVNDLLIMEFVLN